MTATLVARLLSAMYCAEALPWLGSVKHIWNWLSLPSVVATEEADGVRAKMRSAKVSPEVTSQGLEVTEPREICMPQSFSVLYALTAFSGSFWSSS